MAAAGPRSSWGSRRWSSALCSPSRWPSGSPYSSMRFGRQCQLMQVPVAGCFDFACMVLFRPWVQRCNIRWRAGPSSRYGANHLHNFTCLICQPYLLAPNQESPLPLSRPSPWTRPHMSSLATT
jgi:hypothetical protein